MSLPPRFAPPTRLDALRASLADYREGDTSFLSSFHKSLQTLRHLALNEVGQRLARTTTASSLRWAILEAAVRFDWPEWDVHLAAMLQHEEDLFLFGEGCKALGGLCTRRAMDALQRLKKLRMDAERQEILDRELDLYETKLPFEACLHDVMQGQKEPELARQGARKLAALCGPEHLEPLVEAFHQGDAVACHQLLRILAFINDPAAFEQMLRLFQEAKDDGLECRDLAEFVITLKGLPAKAQREKLLKKYEEQFDFCTPALIHALRDKLTDSAHRPPVKLDAVPSGFRGPLKSFLWTSLSLLAQGKVLGEESLIQETAGTLSARESGFAARLDDVADLLATMVEAQPARLEQALPLLQEAFMAGLGGDGLMVACLRLIPCGDQERLDQVLAEPDIPRRMHAIEILGAREEDSLAPFFQRAMNDPAKEVGQLALRQLGKLPSGLAGMLELFRSDQIDRIREAIRFFHENHSKAAVKPLMTFLSSESPDELLVDAVNALDAICDPVATNTLLRELHAGKPLALQLAIVDALAHFGTAAASLGLLKKSEELTLPEVLSHALHGALSAFPSFEQPFPPDQIPALEKLVDRCCDPREGAGRGVHTSLMMDGLYVFNSDIYDRLLDRFTAILVDLRQRSSWDHNNQDLISEVIKKLSRRASKLSSLEDREKNLQTAIETVPDHGPKRMQMFLKLQELLSEPEHILNEACSHMLVTFLENEFARENLDYEEVDLLCKIAGLSGQPGMIPPLEDLLAHATSPGHKTSARKALLTLGLTEQDIDRRKPIASVLLLEPNAFFRNRLVSNLNDAERQVDAVATREEAQAILDSRPVDLLISESHDATGELWPWLEAAWQQRQFRYVLLSTSSHDAGPLTGKTWIIGRLYKPYSMEDLKAAIAG